MPITTFDPSEGPSPEQMEAEQNALEQGEKIAKMQQEDRERAFQQVDDENADAALIGGKFKSQDDLLAAYEALQKKMGQESSDDKEEPSEDQPEASEETEEEEVDEATSETVDYMHSLNKEFEQNGQLSEEAIDKLSSMDSKELIKAYLQYNQQAKTSQVQQSEIDAIQQSVGGPEAYQEMLEWAASNLNETEIAEYNQVTSSGDAVAIKFAVAALANRYRNTDGYEAPLVSGKKAKSEKKVFRSHAELSRAIADPRYSTDPAFRKDVEEKLSRSTDLL